MATSSYWTTPPAGGAWQFRWPSLTYGKAHGVHDLPGLPLGERRPRPPSSEVVGEYFARYESTFDLRVRRPVDVRAVREAGETAAAGRDRRGGVVHAGAAQRDRHLGPAVRGPATPGQETFQGRQLHTAGYRGAAEFAGEHVIVVGGGTSAVQLLMELAETRPGRPG